MIVLCILAMLILLVYPDQSALYAQNALQIWGTDIVPSLFPYMVFCRLLAGRLRNIGIPAFLCIPILGLAGGSPSGASVLIGYAKCLSRRNLHALCALTGTISPAFFLGTVSSWFVDAALGKLLLASQLIGALGSYSIVSIIPIANDWHREIKQTNLDDDTNDPIMQSVQAVLSVGGCIIFFSVAAGMLSSIHGLPMLLRALLHALLEIAGGIHALSEISLPDGIQPVILSFVAGFGGFSILIQNLIVLRKCGIQFIHLALYGLLRAIIAAAAMIVFLQLRRL